MTAVSDVWLSLAFNTAVHESTKSNTDKQFLGRKLKCSLLVWWDLIPESTGKQISRYGRRPIRI
jgi:hypothetical protein